MKKEIVFGTLVVTALAGMNIRTVIADEPKQEEGKGHECKSHGNCKGMKDKKAKKGAKHEEKHEEKHDEHK